MVVVCGSDKLIEMERFVRSDRFVNIPARRVKNGLRGKIREGAKEETAAMPSCVFGLPTTFVNIPARRVKNGLRGKICEGAKRGNRAATG